MSRRWQSAESQPWLIYISAQDGEDFMIAALGREDPSARAAATKKDLHFKSASPRATFNLTLRKQSELGAGLSVSPVKNGRRVKAGLRLHSTQ